MVIKATEKLLFALFQIGCSESATLSGKMVFGSLGQGEKKVSSHEPVRISM